MPSGVVLVSNSGLGEEVYTPSPVPTGSSLYDGGASVQNLDLFLNDASSINSEVGVSRATQSDVSDVVESFRLPLLKIRTFGKPPLSDESGVAVWNGRFRRIEVGFGSRALSADVTAVFMWMSFLRTVPKWIQVCQADDVLTECSPSTCCYFS